MSRIKLSVLIVVLMLAVLVPIASESKIEKPSGLVVHEWGTFTSVAGEDGVALEWRPLIGPSDLPSFVYTLDNMPSGLRDGPVGKGQMMGTVRMETPVIYFYTDREMDVSLKVDFPEGQITEWYPRASLVSTGVDWGTFKLMPSIKPSSFLNEDAASHYYPARETDAVPVRVCSTNGNEFEKFLFYRGVGTFDLPLEVKLDTQRTVKLANTDKKPIGRVMLFERRGDRIGFTAQDVGANHLDLPRPELDEDLDAVLERLEEMLVEEGLYEKEATSMVETWRDHWFEEGLRVFYMVPQADTERLLPLTMDPKPAELVRVLVGRVEVITPELEDTIRARLLKAFYSPEARRAKVLAALGREHGRFLSPIVSRVLPSIEDSTIREKIKSMVESLEPEAH